MSTPKIALAYSIDNIQVAEEIDNRISSASSYRFEHFYGKKTTDPPSLSEQLKTFNGPILLIISDNFLKSAQCMSKGLSMLQANGDRIMPVIANGLAKDDDSGEAVNIPTNFEKVSDIIQYINYWQDQYLDLRRQKRQIKGLDEEKFNAHLKVMREISSEAGEFLRLLRNKEYITYEDFAAEHFHKFFEFVNDAAGYESFRKLDAERTPTEPAAAAVTDTPETEPADTLEEENTLKVDLADIPGIQLLEEDQQTDDDAQADEETPVTGESDTGDEGGAPEITWEIDGISDGDADEQEEEDTFAEPGEALQSAATLFKQGAGDQAIQVLESAIGHFPDDEALRHRYAMYLVQVKHDISAAMRQLSYLLDEDPLQPKTNFLMGELAELNEDFGMARKHYERVASRPGDHPDIFYRLGLVIANHFPDEPEVAVANFKRALEIDSSNADACYQLAMLLNEQLDAPGQAIPYFEKTLSLQPEHPFANYDLAIIYHQQGQMDKALASYREAIRLNPELQTTENDLAFGNHAVTEESEPLEQPEAEEVAVATPDVAEEISEPEDSPTIPEFEPAPAEPELSMADKQPEVIGTKDQAEEPVASPANEEIDPLEALKQNVRRLEEMLKARERVRVEEEPAPKSPGKIVMITGATSGIGRATAKEFAENGYRLILTGRRRERLERLKEIFETVFKTEVRTLCFDVKEPEAIAEVLRELPYEWRQVDILINNAGKAKGLDLIHSGRLEHWEEMIDTNIKGLLYMSRAILPYMVRRRSGHIINVASTAGKDVYPKGNVYSATKFAVEALTKAMRIDLLPYNIRVSQVSPGAVEGTEFSSVRFEGDEEKAQIYNDFVPLNSRDVAETIYFIATRPAHVNIQDVLMTSTQQADSNFFDRSGRTILETLKEGLGSSSLREEENE